MVVTSIRFFTSGVAAADPTLFGTSNPNFNLIPKSNPNPNPTLEAFDPNVRWKSVHLTYLRWQGACLCLVRPLIFYYSYAVLRVSVGAYVGLWIIVRDPWVRFNSCYPWNGGCF